MPSYTVIIQTEAEQDLDDAYHYFEQQKVGLGFQLLEYITEVVTHKTLPKTRGFKQGWCIKSRVIKAGGR